MRAGKFVIVLSVLLGTPAPFAWAFEDVPPWHWAFDGVQKAATAGVVIGYPAVDREDAINAVIQVYDAFAHATHPAARAWAERFMASPPSTWPQPLQRSSLQAFRLEDVRVVLSGERGTVSFVAAVTLRGAAAESRARMRVEVRKDTEGRWRASYDDMAAGQPAIFR